MLWSLNKLADTVSNYLTVSYIEDNPNGQYYPDRIDYTGNANAGKSPQNSVRFVYETRPDTTPLYQVGSLMRNTVRLGSANTFSGNNLVKEYRLTYDMSPTTGRSRSTRITECTGNGDCLNATTVAYEAWEAGASAPQLISPATLEVMHGNTSVSHMNGVRLVDLNGDGRLDIARSIYAQGTTYAESWINTGSGWINAPDFVPPVTLEVSHGNANLNHHNGVQLIDLNGDGRLDIMQGIYALGTTYSGAWINTGSGWASAPQYAPPVTLEVMHGNVNLNHHNGVQLIDLNGDGRLDIMQGIYALGTTYSGAWINTGSGWTSAPQYAPPVTVEVMHGNTSVSHMNGVRLIDLNGDGRQDLMQYIYAQGTSYAGAWINTGSGWVSAPQFLPPAMLEVNHGNANLNHLNGVQLVDINGDSRLDMVQNIYATGTTYSGAWINTGLGWASAPQYAPPVALEVMNGDVNYNHHNGVKLIDLNGDGGVDYLQSIYAVGSTYTGAWLNPKGSSDLLASITNGFGVTANLTSKPLTNDSVYTKDSGAVYPYVDIQAPMYVVSSVSVSDGTGGNAVTNYTYAGAKSRHQGGGFLGFRQVTAHDPQAHIRSTTTYRQDYPYHGQPLTSHKHTDAGVLLGQNLITYTDQLIDPSKSPAWHRSLPTRTVESSYELDGSPISSVTTDTQYDSWGNPTTIVVNSGGGYSKTTTNLYDNIVDPDRWFLGRLRRSTVNSVTP